jgi:hypothetical protein
MASENYFSYELCMILVAGSRSDGAVTVLWCLRKCGVLPKEKINSYKKREKFQAQSALVTSDSANKVDYHGVLFRAVLVFEFENVSVTASSFIGNKHGSIRLKAETFRLFKDI